MRLTDRGEFVLIATLVVLYLALIVLVGKVVPRVLAGGEEKPVKVAPVVTVYAPSLGGVWWPEGVSA